MIATERRRSAWLPLVFLCASTPGACAQGADDGPASDREPRPSADQAGPETDLEDASAECAPGACDPLCVDRDRYRVTPDVVVDTKSDDRLWQRRVSVQRTHAEAIVYCADLTLDGLRGWRLPSPVELSSIRYKPGGLFGGGSRRHYCIPSIDQAAFPGTPADQFWTSRANADDTAWYVGFDDGRMHRDTRTAELWVRCVHEPVATP